MNAKIRIELSVMMFLQFFIWGAWAVTMGAYLGKIGFSGADIGRAYSTTAIAAILSPFFVGMVADRFFSAQKVLGLLHLAGAVLMFFAAKTTEPMPFFWVLLAYALCYMPTLALTNAIAFNQMDNTERQFPAIRVFGTLGWIVAGIAIGLVSGQVGKNIELTSIPLFMAAGCSVLMGFYSFFLPSTPPAALGKKVSIGEVLGLDALKLMKEFSFTVFVLSSLLICIPLAFYYNFTNMFLNESGMASVATEMNLRQLFELGWKDFVLALPSFFMGSVAAKMTMGQMSEVAFMLVMPFFFKRLGVKKMLLVGMLAWVARYLLFAYGNTGPLVFMFYGGILLHGVCYDFFFVTGQIYVDKVAPESIRASAQGFIALVTYGVGMAIGSMFVSGYVVDSFATVNEANEVVGHVWRNIWLVPAGMALVVAVLFMFLFRAKVDAEATGE